MTTINRRSTLCLSSILTASLWLAGCSTPAHVALPDSDTVKARHQAALTLADLPPAQVLIQDADTLRIVRDAQEPAKNDEMTLFVVRPDGFISMPNIGRIKAAQRTPEDLGKEITERYKNVFREPAVTVNIAIAPSNRVFIGGASQIQRSSTWRGRCPSNRPCSVPAACCLRRTAPTSPCCAPAPTASTTCTSLT